MISVIIPLYNKSWTIERALSSVLAQTFQDFEIIIVDDGSTDDSATKVEKYLSERITLIAQPNAGPGAARNKGASVARGELLAFLDADDEWLPHHLAEAYAGLGAYADCLAYACAYDSGAFRAVRPNLVQKVGLSDGPSSALSVSNEKSVVEMTHAMHSSCVVVRKTVFDQLGGYYSADRCLFGEDSFLWLQVLFSGPVCWSRAENVIFHVEDSELGYALTHFSKPTPISLHHACLLEKYGDKSPLVPKVLRQFVEVDIRRLVNSGSFAMARELRREVNLPEVSIVGDVTRYVGVRMKSAARRLTRML